MLVLLQASHEDPAATIPGIALGWIVCLLALALAVLAWQAARKRANPGLRFVAAAFAIFAMKGAFSATNLKTHAIPHDEIELILSLFDLALLATLFVPFLRRPRG